MSKRWHTGDSYLTDAMYRSLLYNEAVTIYMYYNVMYTEFKMKSFKLQWQNQQNDCAPSDDSDQPGHLPSLIRVFAVRMKKAWVLSYPFSAERRLWSDWADAQADLSLCWAHTHFVGFVMLWLNFFYHNDLKFSDSQVWANSIDPDLEKQSGHSLLGLPFRLHLLDSLHYGKATLFEF